MPRVLHDWSAVQAQHDAGLGFVACQRQFGFSHTAWVKAIKRGTLRSGERAFTDRRRRYDWPAVQRYYDEGHSFRECQAHFGFCAASWTKAVRRGELKPRPRGQQIEQLLAYARGRTNIKNRLLKSQMLLNKCNACGIQDWLGRPLSLQIDHINGIRDDNRLENLQMLCPNCHSQTATFAGKNIRRRRRLQE